MIFDLATNYTPLYIHMHNGIFFDLISEVFGDKGVP